MNLVDVCSLQGRFSRMTRDCRISALRTVFFAEFCETIQPDPITDMTISYHLGLF